MIFTIACRAPGVPIDREVENVLRNLAEITGGRALSPAHPDEIAPAYAQVRAAIGRD